MAVRDIEHLESLFEGQRGFAVDLVNPLEDSLADAATQLRIYHPTRACICPTYSRFWKTWG